MYLALHHGGARVIFDIPLPSTFWHLQMLGEALLSEVFNGVVVGVSDEVLYSNGLGMCLKSIHQSSAISFHLLRSRDGQKYNFSKPLTMKWSEHASTNNRARLGSWSQHAWTIRAQLHKPGAMNAQHRIALRQPQG